MKIWPSIIILFIFVTSLIFFAFTDDVSNAMQNLYCDLGLKSEKLCPIDGEWSSWSSWESCSGKCGFKGKKIRHRICNNPIPSNNGAPCIGPNYQIESCHITGCTMNDYEKVVNIHPIRKEELEIVKDIHQKLPALIELCFLADCTFSIVEKILGNNSMLYWNAMNCIKYNVGCPSPGGWSAWGIWSPCTAICGKGLKYRTRICNSPIPSNYKLICRDSALETKNCLGLNCKKLSTGTWTNWSKWTMCSVKCGNGIQTRKRSCSEIQNLQGTSCKGVSKEIKDCTINNCSINGMWSSWTIWSSCTSSCGIGTQLRNRMCNNPSPNGNGTSCFGSASEIRQCFTKPCIASSNNVQYLLGDDNEGFIYIGLTDSIEVPCPKCIEYWQITIAIKIENINGIVAIITDDSLNKYILLLIEEGKIKLKFYQGATYITIESIEHISIREWFEIIVAYDSKNVYMQVNGNEKKYIPLGFEEIIIISVTDIFLGAIRDNIREKICSECAYVPQMSFTLGYFNINGEEIDLITLSILETSSKRFSSRTISISGQELKLSCFYDTIPHEKRHIFSKQTYATWILMDKLLLSYENNYDFFNIRDDGRVSTVSIASYTTRDTIENFYSCLIYHYKNKSLKTSRQALFTFGIVVLDKSEVFESVIWKEWSFICKFTIMCFTFMIIWCLLEILQDIKNGYGFYRLPQIISNSTSIINFVLSKNGVTLLGSQQAANEVVSKILND
ncbi:uncharacterized protein LOC108001856 isoform X3 [Apis cerana]|uniref:uncharacterized protein LOC108001856 isoform X3 n=1 Tax=Apis cerana TaxID=7461 RepID=UPI002B234F52|nr:uncharacterized protein LOC108001856 isoform X3 [Apis cerana]